MVKGLLAICSDPSVSSREALSMCNMNLLTSDIKLSQIPQVFPVAGDAPGVPEISTLLWITERKRLTMAE